MEAKIDMIGIITSKFNEMLTFYRDVLGFKVKMQMESNYVEFENSGVRFAISTSKVMADATGHDSYKAEKRGQSLELAFRVPLEEMDKTFKEIVDKGAGSVKSPEDMPWNQRAAFFSDPDGNIHEIFADIPKKT